MATELVYQQQLQALATATANFANDKDAAIKATIINALENKPEPTLTVSHGAYTYNGDGDIFGYVANSNIALKINREQKTWAILPNDGGDHSITLHATETANFAAKSVTYNQTAD